MHMKPLDRVLHKRLDCVAGLFLGGLICFFSLWLPPALFGGVVQHFGTGHTWPADGEWVAVSSLNDGTDLVAGKGYLDFVGDATDPCFYRAFKDVGGKKYIYFRVRVKYSGAVVYGGAPFDSANIMVLVKYNTPGDNYPDYAFTWDAKSNDISKHGLEMQVRGSTGIKWSNIQMDDADTNPNTKTSPPDFNYTAPAPGAGTDGFIRTVDGVGTTNFGTTTFVDFSISCDLLKTNNTANAARYTILCGQSWQLQVASIDNATDHNAIGGDVGHGANPSSDIAGTWSDAVSTLVELSRFEGSHENGKALLTWKTASEIDNAGFHLWRAEGEGPYVRITTAMIPALGSSVQGAEYAFEDSAVYPNRIYSYKLEDIDMNGQSAFHGPVAVYMGTIDLISPSDASRGLAGIPPRFAWDTGIFASFKIEFSRDADFGVTIFTLPGHGREEWIQEGAYFPTKPEWNGLRSAAGGYRTVYWRIRARILPGAEIVSESRRLLLR